MGTIDGEARRLVATLERPHRLHLEGLRVYFRDAVLVFEVHEDMARGVGDGELRFGLQRQRADDPVSARIDCRYVFAPTIESEHAMRVRLVENGVRVLAGSLDLGDPRERGEIEDNDASRCAGADVTPAKIFGKRDSV